MTVLGVGVGVGGNILNLNRKAYLNIFILETRAPHAGANAWL